MAIVNTMEELVKERLDDAIKEIECCDCQKCREDILCISLNALQPRYVSTEKGEVMSKLAQAMRVQRLVDVEVALANAVSFVKKHPKHDI